MVFVYMIISVALTIMLFGIDRYYKTRADRNGVRNSRLWFLLACAVAILPFSFIIMKNIDEKGYSIKNVSYGNFGVAVALAIATGYTIHKRMYEVAKYISLVLSAVSIAYIVYVMRWGTADSS